MAILIARSEPRERHDVDNGTFWSEYRVRRMTDTEFYERREAGQFYRNDSYQPIVIEVRYVRTEGDAVREEEWKPWFLGNTAAEVIDEMLGDTRFLESPPLHPLHAELVRRTKERREAGDRASKLDGDCKAAAVAIDNFKHDEQRAYDKKVVNMTAEKEAAFKARTLKRITPRLEELRATYNRLDAERREAAAHVEALKNASTDDLPVLEVEADEPVVA